MRYNVRMQKKKVKILPATEARKEFFNIIRDASNEKSFYVITVGGMPTATIVAFDKDALTYGKSNNKRAVEEITRHKPNAKKLSAQGKTARKRAR